MAQQSEQSTHTHGENYGHSHDKGQLPHDHGNADTSDTGSTPLDGPNIAHSPETQSTLEKLPLPKNVEDIQTLLGSWGDQILSWLQSPSFLGQVGAILLAIFLSPILAGVLRKRLPFFVQDPTEGRLLKVRQILYMCRSFLRAIVLVGLLALFSFVLKNIEFFGQDSFVKAAQSLAVVFLLYRMIKQFVSHELKKKVAIWTIIPTALLIVFGYFDKFIGELDATPVLPMGDNPITALTIAKLVIFGALFFWLGGVSNHKGQTAIRNQESLDASTREVVAKIFQMVLFAILFLLLLTVAGIPLSGLVVIFSALTLGIGLGLQPVAANFVSGLIILFDRTVQVGDFVQLPEGTQGHVEAINMRSTTVETTDGKDIMVPNTLFIEQAYENWTHKDPRQRYEVYFSVAYNTDIDILEGILIPAVSAHPKVLQEPEKPDLELREFADFGIKFAIEFWADGIDDGENKFTSDLNYIVWRALKANDIQMPLPQREVRLLK